MIDPRISRDPVGLIRMKGKGGAFLYSEKECERWIEMILLDRAVKLWAKEKPPELEQRKEPAGSNPVFGKPTGRGKLFWVDSE
jgi:hypothetical protein